ncbi:hypothetical protein PBY51_005752 [Eleginops maclovinus]|uniref:Uncharacterized protein n=1 Tax=Eleginops maclovinus TaxID=56733 RepID=A0AAN7WN48_ELEMC|nr:hypothetical protein PBY51_005752 [Eleginops maclovinus]
MSKNPAETVLTVRDTQQCSMMLLHTDGKPLKTHLRTLSVLVLLLLLTHHCRGQSQLIGSSQPIVANLGDDIILPCYLEPADLKREGGHKSKQRNTSEEKRRREEAEKEVQTLKEELQTKKREVESKQSELQDLLSEKQRKEKELQSLKEDLEKKSRELETIQRSINKPSSSLWFQKKAEQMKKKMKEKEKKKEKDEAEQEVETLQKHLETKQEETELNIKEFEDRRAEVQKLQEAVQGMEASLQTLMGDLESRNMESQAGGPMEPLLTPQTQTSDSGFDIEDKQLGLWELYLQVNTKQSIKFTFDQPFILQAGESVRMWARGCGSSYSNTDLKWKDLKPCCSGDRLQFTLYSNTGEIQHELCVTIP